MVFSEASMTSFEVELNPDDDLIEKVETVGYYVAAAPPKLRVSLL